jgi:hypothetical protein
VGRASVVPPAPVDPYEPLYEPLYEPVYAPAPVFYPVPKRRPRVLATIGFMAAMCILGSVVTLLVYALLRPAAHRPTAGPSAPAATTPAAPTKPAPPGLGTPVRDGKFEFVVTNVECGRSKVTAGPVKLDAHGQYCLVNLSVRNIGTSRQTFSEAFQKAIGDDGQEYGPDIPAGLVVNGGGNGLVNSLSPGETVTGTMVFDVPRKVQLATLELHDSILSGGVTVTV